MENPARGRNPLDRRIVSIKSGRLRYLLDGICSIELLDGISPTELTHYMKIADDFSSIEESAWWDLPEFSWWNPLNRIRWGPNWACILNVVEFHAHWLSLSPDFGAICCLDLPFQLSRFLPLFQLSDTPPLVHYQRFRCSQSARKIAAAGLASGLFGLVMGFKACRALVIGTG